MNHNDLEADKFAQAIRPMLRSYAGLSIACVGFKESETLRIIQATVTLALVPDQDALPEVFESTHLAALRHFLPLKPEAIAEALEKIRRTGHLPEIKGRSFSLPIGEGGTFGSYFKSPSVGELNNGRRILSLGITGEMHSKLLNNSMRDLDFEVRANRTPFESVQDLFLAYGLPAQIFGDFCRVDIIAPPVVEIDQSAQIVSGVAQIRLIAGRSVRTQDVRVGWRVNRSGSGPLRGSAEGQDIRWTDSGGFLRGSFDLPVADKAFCLCFVSYASEFQHQWWLVDPSLILNPRRAIHACFDPSLDFLQDLVLEERNRKGPARKFEDGIAYLLHILGFRVQHFKAPLDDAPDIVACADSHDVLVVECTRDRLNSGGKLAKLKVRTSQIRRALMEADLPNARIIPVIVTALPQSDILEEAASSEAQDVVVVTLDDLRRLIDETRFNPDPHRAIFERAAAAYKRTPG